MRKTLSVLILFLSLVAFGYPQSLVQHVKELQRKKQAGEISETEYNELLSIILKSSSSGEVDESANNERPRTIRTTGQTWPVQLNLLIARYWRAKELVNLNTELELQCNGRSMPGKVLVMDADKILVAFIDDVEQGNAHFRIRYRPNVKAHNGGGFVPQIFDFEFMHSITGEMEISKVIDFIEIKGRNGSVADAKILDQSDYQSLIDKRRGKEQQDKKIFNKFFGNK